MIEGTGAIGPRNWIGQWRRGRTERWMRRIVRGIRSGKMQVPKSSAAYLISTFQDHNGRLLDEKSAAVELINILRPTVANARYIVFAAIALNDHPDWATRLQQSDDELGLFVDEVRRNYPFIPLIGGRVLKEFTWRNHTFRRKDWVLFDLYGTNHDPHIWANPEVFRPERFREKTIGPYDLVSSRSG
jgi:fatty-acid peroxygenase